MKHIQTNPMTNLTQQEIEEGNRLINDWMKGKSLYSFFKGEKAYHKKWDILMHVISALEKQGWKIDILSMATIVYEDKPAPTAFSSLQGDRITRTWLAVVEFIEWYNQNQKG